MSNDGVTPLFGNNLGLTAYPDGSQIPVDIFLSAPLDNTFMECRIYYGDKSRSVPVKVICGNLKSNLAAGQALKFAIGIINPQPLTMTVIKSQIALPLFIYSFDPYLFNKINFNTINAAIYVNNAANVFSPNGYFYTTSNKLQTKN